MGQAIMNALDRLEAGMSWGRKFIEPVRVGGIVTEVAMSHYRVAGLSRFLKLGECVSLDADGRPQIGEVVRIDGGTVTLKPFDSRCDAGIGARAFRTENLSLSPHPLWKGRVIDALGRPIDTSLPLEQGERTMPLDAEPPPAMRRSRHRFLLAALRRAENWRLRRVGRRQIFAAGDAGPIA
jgi:flagellum-specific ATP synthase